MIWDKLATTATLLKEGKGGGGGGEGRGRILQLTLLISSLS